MFSEVRPLSIELYLLLNLAPDLALLGAASRALGLFNARRVLAAGALCAAHAGKSDIPEGVKEKGIAVNRALFESKNPEAI